MRYRGCIQGLYRDISPMMDNQREKEMESWII